MVVKGLDFNDRMWVKVDQDYVEGQALALAIVDFVVIVPED
jgi:hypothetical protein